MKGRIGCPTSIVTVLPRQRELAKLETTELSAKARFRLEVFDWHRNESPKFTRDGKPAASLTCRHFGIHRSYFHRWDKRFDRRRLSTLEDRPTAPGRRREPSYRRELVRRVREIRRVDPTYSAKKIRPILLRTEPEANVPSVATIGRLIARGSFVRTRKGAKNSRGRRQRPTGAGESRTAFRRKRPSGWSS